MSDSTYTPKTYRKQGGEEFVVASGGKITVESGGILNVETGGVVKANGTQAASIADVTVTATYGDDNTAIETAINSIIAALVGAGIVAAS